MHHPHDGPGTSTPVVPGYRLDGSLGAGGSAVVWAATRVDDGLAVAVKVVSLDVPPSDTVAPDTVAPDTVAPDRGAPPSHGAVAREIAVLAELDVEHVVRVLEVVDVEVPVPGVALVLERLDGGTLGGLVAARGHLTAGEVVTVAAPVGSALGAVHALGIVHGDVSPGNILFDTSGRPVLADLGLAGIVGEARTTVDGTDGFVPPEVLLGDPRTCAGDVYSVGAVMWFCLTGEPPPPSPVRPPLADLVPGLPRALGSVVEACLSTDPGARPAASVVALEVYDSTPAEPLRLRTGEDLASGVTRRIRSTAQASSQVGLWDDPVPAEPRTGRSRARTIRRALTRSPVATAPTKAVVAVVGLVLAGGLVVGGFGALGRLMPGGPLPGGGQTGVGRSTDQSDAEVAAVREHPPGGGAPREGPGPRLTTVGKAAVEDPRGLLTALARARARAWNTEDAAALRRVDAPGSPALSADRTLVERAVAAGADYEGVDFTVRDAELLSYDGEWAAVRVTVRTGAYRVTWPDGTVESPGATQGRPVVVDLVRCAGTWKVHRVRAP